NCSTPLFDTPPGFVMTPASNSNNERGLKLLRHLENAGLIGLQVCKGSPVGPVHVTMALASDNRTMQRRALIGGMALASGGLLIPSAAAIAEQAPPNSGVVSVKDPQFGAIGDFRADDTKAIQAAADYCFGPPTDPHGTAKVSANHVLYFPPGIYKITAPIKLAKLHGARVIGSGRFVTKIINAAGGSVLATNGCGYSHFEGMYLQAADKSSPVFDLNWDGKVGGPALQSNSFIEMFFDGGATGVDIGAGGFMGSENIFINCFWIYCAVAGLKTSNFNA